MQNETTTKFVEEFYRNVQFPAKYNEEEVLDKTSDFYLKDYLKLKFLPFKASILDAGCGTGFTTHVISSLRHDATITAIDLSKNSLSFAENYSKENNIKNTKFQLMDLNKLTLEQNFDMIHSSGVLHHTKNPRPIFHELCKLLKPNGVFICGLYHPYGRFSVHARQKFFKISGGRFRNIDPRLRTENWTDERKEIWFRDQYDHPHERDYGHKTLLEWFKEENLQLVGSIPKYSGNNFSYNFELLTKYGSQGGLFIFVGRKIV